MHVPCLYPDTQGTVPPDSVGEQSHGLRRSLQSAWRRILHAAVHKLLAKLALHGLLNSGTQMSHLCFISASAALRLSTSAPGNNGLARAHPHQLAGDLLCRPGLCLLSALSRRLDGSSSPERLCGPV